MKDGIVERIFYSLQADIHFAASIKLAIDIIEAHGIVKVIRWKLRSVLYRAGHNTRTPVPLPNCVKLSLSNISGQLARIHKALGWFRMKVLA